MRKIRWNGWHPFLFIFILYFFALIGTSVPLTGDQKTYLSIALEMRARHEWLIPYFFDKVNFLKPPFQYWTTLLGFDFFGVNRFGAFLPPFFALLGCAWLVQKIAKRTQSLVPVFFVATLGSMTYGTTAQMEIWVTLALLISWHLLSQGMIGAVCFTLGVLSWIKGPLYPILFVWSAVFYYFIENRGKEIKSTKNLLLLIGGGILGLSWYIYAYLHFPTEILEVFFQRENLSKIQTHQGSAVSLWVDFLFSLMPLTFWLFMSFGQVDFKNKWKTNRNFWISFGLIFVLFFTFFPYHVGAYLYPMTPLAVWMMSETDLKKNRWVLFCQGLVLTTTLLLFLVLIRLYGGEWISLPLLLLGILSTALWAVFHFLGRAKGVAWSALLLVVTIRLASVSIGERDLAGLTDAIHELKTTKLAYLIDREDIWHEWGWISVALGQTTERLKNPYESQRFMNEGGALLVSDEAVFDRESLTCRDWIRLKRRMKLPLKEIVAGHFKASDPQFHRTFHVCTRRQAVE